MSRDPSPGRTRPRGCSDVALGCGLAIVATWIGLSMTQSGRDADLVAAPCVVAVLSLGAVVMGRPWIAVGALSGVLVGVATFVVALLGAINHPGG